MLDGLHDGSLRSRRGALQAAPRLGLTVLLAAAAVACGEPAATASDRYEITLAASGRDEPATGRVVLFFIDESERRYGRRAPVGGPFWDPPQPIASVAVSDLAPGASVTIDGSAAAFPASIDALEGTFRVQALLDASETERSPMAEPDNLIGEPVTVQLRRDRADTVALRLERRVPGPRALREAPNLRWVELRSESLSRFYGREVVHRAGVALPPAALADDAGERRWPTVYVVPGFGGRHHGARTYAQMLGRPGIADIAPSAVFVVLDPESPLGHHGFADSPNHGPRGTALVQEFIPHLEATFPLAARAEARVVTGHSSGGWSSLWLQLRHPDVFGGCWASAPDPVDFRAFQRSNLYEDASVYTDADGELQPSYRAAAGANGEMRVVMTVRDECRMERAIDPTGGSGEQWDAWEAMFSPRDAATGRPRPMFDVTTGAIDRDVVDTHWSKYDISRLVTREWDRLGPVVMERVHLHCGELDSFYLDGAVRGFKAAVEARAAASGGWSGPGYIRLVPDATHGTLSAEIFQDVNREMMEHFRNAGF